MKKIYLLKVIFISSLLISSGLAYAQCPAGSSTANVNWDNLDYLTQTGTYAGFVTTAMMQSQKFAIGRNRFSIDFPVGTMSTAGENITNTAEAGSFGSGADVEYNGNGTITITFDTVVQNLQFSLYDIDLSQTVRVTAQDGFAMPLNIDMTLVAAGVVTIVGTGGTTPTATANTTALLNSDTKGTINISILGNSPAAANGVKKVTLIFGYSGGTPGNFWLSDISACVFGTFPTNYYLSQKPFAGQPGYYLVTPDNNSVYLFNPLTGRSDWLFSEPASPWVNSMAYDPNNHILYYVRDNPSPVSTNKMLKKYDFNTETIGVVVPDLTTIGIPLFDIVVESAGAAFYDGALYLGIEGSNSAKNSNRECIIWRIDFDASLNPIKTSQVFARPADNGAGTLTHDWGDFTIKDGVLFDFNTGNLGSTSQFIHYSLQNGNSTIYNTNGTPAPIQAGQTWNGTLYWTGGQPPETGRVAVYNENGTIGPKIVATTTACSPAWVGRAGDASDPFRPKSDFGDAPDTYDPVPSSKATHEFDCNLRLGATFDKEWDKTPSPNATADGSDEDGISPVTLLPIGTITYVQDVKVYNNTGASATLVGWLDYNANGIFEPAEGVTVTVASSAAMQTKTLSWSSITVKLPIGSTTFLRIRLTSSINGMTVNNSTGWYPNGEVEDYLVNVNSVLPVQLLSFTGHAESNNRVLLSWTTGKEVNLSGFYVQRSGDGLSWNDISFVPGQLDGKETNNYNFYDYDPLEGKSYYRLKLVSVDETYRYSEVIVMQLKQTNAGFKITPNPIHQHATLSFTGDRNESAVIYVIDASGKKVMSRTVQFAPGINQVNLDNWNSVIPGVYIVQVVTTTKTTNAKVIVQ